MTMYAHGVRPQRSGGTLSHPPDTPDPPGTAGGTLQGMRTHGHAGSAHGTELPPAEGPGAPHKSRAWATERAARAAVAAAATPGTRAVGPTPTACSATRMLGPQSPHASHSCLRCPIPWRYAHRVRPSEATARLPAVPKAAPRRPLMGWRGEQRPRRKQSLPAAPIAWERSAAEARRQGTARSHVRYARRKYAWRTGRARSIIGS